MTPSTMSRQRSRTQKVEDGRTSSDDNIQKETDASLGASFAVRSWALPNSIFRVCEMYLMLVTLLNISRFQLHTFKVVCRAYSCAGLKVAQDTRWLKMSTEFSTMWRGDVLRCSFTMPSESWDRAGLSGTTFASGRSRPLLGHRAGRDHQKTVKPMIKQ